MPSASSSHEIFDCQHKRQIAKWCNMTHIATRYSQINEPWQLDLSLIRPASFVNIELPTRRAEVYPPPPPSSPRCSVAQRWLFSPDSSTVQCLSQSVGTSELTTCVEEPTTLYDVSASAMDLNYQSCSEEEKSLVDFQSVTCVSERINSMQVDCWSRCNSSCSETTMVLEDIDINDESPLDTANPIPDSEEDDEIPRNLRLTDWPASKIHTYPLYRTTPSSPSKPTTRASIMCSNAHRIGWQPSSPEPEPSSLIESSLLLGSPPMSPMRLSLPLTPITPVHLEPNERSFMDFDDSDSDECKRRVRKTASLSRVFDQNRKGHQRRSFGRSLSEVFQALSCSN